MICGQPPLTTEQEQRTSKPNLRKLGNNRMKVFPRLGIVTSCKGLAKRGKKFPFLKVFRTRDFHVCGIDG